MRGVKAALETVHAAAVAAVAVQEVVAVRAVEAEVLEPDGTAIAETTKKAEDEDDEDEDEEAIWAGRLVYLPSQLMMLMDL